MASTTIENRPLVAPAVAAVLDGLKLRIRWYVWLYGATAALAWLGLAFWISLAIDYAFEPARGVRLTILAVVGLAAVGVLVHLIFRRAFVPMSRSNMAMVLERRFPKFNDSLLTAVVLAGRELDPAKCNPSMLARTCREAAERIGGLELRRVFNPLPLCLTAGGALLLAVSMAVFAALLPDAMGTWVRRNLLLADELWPRNTRLEIKGFKDGVEKVARGADFDISVRADTSFPKIPQTVEIRYQVKGGAAGHKFMDREHVADPEKEPFQAYSFTFKGVTADIYFQVIGGDDRVPGPDDERGKQRGDDHPRQLKIEVVENPTLSAMVLECRYPAYIGRKDRTLPVSGEMRLPAGTQVKLRARANKELVRVQIDRHIEIDASGSELRLPLQTIEAHQLTGQRRSFEHWVGTVRENTRLLFTLSDTDKIKTREPVQLKLAALPDEPPHLEVRLDGIGTAITPEARLPVVGQITDDYGLERIWAEASLDQQPLPAQTLAALRKRPTSHTLTDVGIEVQSLKVAPGQKLLLCIKAADLYDLKDLQGLSVLCALCGIADAFDMYEQYDLCDLDRQPNVGASERWLLDVVTADQLRAMLEARELVLRQRFERMVQEMTETRDLVAHLTFDTESKKSADDSKKTAADSKKSAAAKKSAEPGDEESTESPERRGMLQMLRVQGALSNSLKSAQEALGVAEAFDDIRKQLINNRIDTEELKKRLEDGIAKPLHKIADEMFPELDQRLEKLLEVVSDPQRGPKQRDRAYQQADDIYVAMQRVLDRMIELEDFNQAVEMLRTIIKLQDAMDDLTKQRQKETIRKDLKED